MSVAIERGIRPATRRDAGISVEPLTSVKPASRSRVAVVALVGLRLAIGFEFLWAFLDKTFGLGYATPSARAWIHGGSPTRGFLSGAIGPLQGVFNNIAGAPVVDWLFMLGLLGVGVALILGVAVRVAALAGAVMLALMYVAIWLPTTVAAGHPTGSTNPIVDAHIVAILGLLAVAALAGWGGGYLGHRWESLRLVSSRWYLR